MIPTPSLLHNNSKRRRFRRDLAKALNKGPSGTPHPWGNREYRRSKQGKAEILLRLQKETMALREMFTTSLKEEKDVVDGQVSSEA
jgi:hypothetical protein